MREKKSDKVKLTNFRITPKVFKKTIPKLILYLVLFDLAFVFLYPFIKMVADALKSEADLQNITVKWIPNSFYWSNFTTAFKMLQYPKYFTNSVFVALAATVGHVFGCAFIGYGFARYNFRGKGFLFGGVILSMLIPDQVLIFPLYMMFSKIGWLDSYLPLIAPTFLGFGLRGGFFIFLFRQFFAGMPYEMEEAARIDGCGPLGIFMRIMVPMSKSSVLVATVLSVVWHWNDYFAPRIYISTTSKMFLPSRLPGMYEILNKLSSESAEILPGESLIVNEALCMAATFLVILPLLIIYTFVQKKFIEGVERSGLTGM